MSDKRSRSCLLPVFLLAAAAGGFIWYSCHLYQLKQTAVAELAGPAVTTAAAPDKPVVRYDGKEYERNPSIKAYLCIGVDSAGELEQRVSGDGGQADSLFVAAYDAAREKVRILMIPRDTITPILLTDLSGRILGKDAQSISLAYGYGDGRELSCERTAEAVSELLGGLEIDGYLAMNTGLIAELNDIAGGVPVYIESDGMEQRDPALQKGSTVTLSGEQAEIFLRYRDIRADHSALTRMSRQKQYLESYLQALQHQAAGNDQTIVVLMDLIEQRMITDLTKDQYLNIAKAVLLNHEVLGAEDILTLPGKGVLTELFDEYHHDPEGTRQMVLELFYRVR